MSPISSSRDRIIIVGAGPSGMTVARVLAYLGVDCDIVDKADGPAKESKSFTLHSRTMELFNLLGCDDRFLERGIPNFSMDYHFSGYQDVVRLDFTTLPSRFPFINIIPQNDTEEVLRDELASLGIRVHWRTELRSVINENGGVTARLVKTDDGSEITVHANWLVGCDGIRSGVRTALGVDQTGDEYTGMAMKMMDGPVTGYEEIGYERNRIHYNVKPTRTLLLAGFPDGNSRVLTSEKADLRQPETTTAAFQSVADDHFGPGKITIGESVSRSTFSIYRRHSTVYRDENIFLCGDANHLNSIIGGQGMNLCIHEAYNLAWKLAMVVRGFASKSILDTYGLERRPCTETLLARTHELNGVVMGHDIPLEERIEKTREPGWLENMVRSISGLSYSYRDVITPPAGLTPRTDLAVGDRIPDVALTTPGRRLHDLLRHPFYTLLAVRDGQSASEWAALDAQIAKKFGERVKVVSILAPEQQALAPTGPVDGNDFNLFGAARRDQFILARPDGYVGACGQLSEGPALLAALDEVLI